jgi:hypothetical protein
MKKKKPTWEDVIQVAKNRGMTPEEFIKMLIDNVDPILFGERFLKYSVKHWCDDLENIIKKEFMIK